MLFNSGNPSLLGLVHLFSGDPSDSPNPMWTPQEKKDAINVRYEEMRELARFTDEGQTRKRSYADAVADQMFYELPGEFVGRLMVEISNNGSDLSTAAATSAAIIVLKPVGYDAALDGLANNAITEIKYAFTHGEHFGIAAIPTSTQAGTNTLRITYEASTTYLSGDTDEPEIIRPYQYLLSIGAAIDLRLTKNLPVGHLERRWSTGIQLYRRALSERQADYEGQMAVAGITATKRKINVGMVKKKAS